MGVVVRGCENKAGPSLAGIGPALSYLRINIHHVDTICGHMVYIHVVLMNETKGGTALKAIRDFLDLSQDEFAHLIGSTKNTISRRENGSNPMLSLSEVVKLQDALSVKGKTIRDFLGQTETP
jgi:DNA-binding XRE family transcriptional regulator